MSKDNGNGKLTHDLLIAYDQRQAKILEKVGGIDSKMDTLINNGIQDREEMRREIKKLNERVDCHLKDHAENPEIMGGAPFLRKYSKKHWKAVLIFFFAAQLAMAVILVKYGVEKIIGIFQK